MMALMLSLAAILATALGWTILMLVVGSYLMQTGVQGAFGAIPAHLNELSPDSARSRFPGFMSKLAALIASPVVSIEFLLLDHWGIPLALTIFEIVVIVMLLFIFALGTERDAEKAFELKPVFPPLEDLFAAQYLVVLVVALLGQKIVRPTASLRLA